MGVRYPRVVQFTKRPLRSRSKQFLNALDLLVVYLLRRKDAIDAVLCLELVKLGLIVLGRCDGLEAECPMVESHGVIAWRERHENKLDGVRAAGVKQQRRIVSGSQEAPTRPRFKDSDSPVLAKMAHDLLFCRGPVPLPEKELISKPGGADQIVFVVVPRVLGVGCTSQMQIEHHDRQAKVVAFVSWIFRTPEFATKPPVERLHLSKLPFDPFCILLRVKIVTGAKRFHRAPSLSVHPRPPNIGYSCSPFSID